MRVYSLRSQGLFPWHVSSGVSVTLALLRAQLLKRPVGTSSPQGIGCGDAGEAKTAEQWRQNATQHEGSWWEEWAKWLEPRSGEKVDPPGVGSEEYPPIEDAPGTYVRES